MTTDPISQRFEAATAAIREIGVWLDSQGETASEGILSRASGKGMTSQEYFHWWKSCEFLDPRLDVEQHELEDYAIRKVQPNWRRRS